MNNYSNRRIKVLIITNVPAPYRVDFFNDLGKLCDLTVVFDKSTSDERDSSWCNKNFCYFSGIILNGMSINTDTAICPGIVKLLKNMKFDHIINTNIYSPTGMLAVIFCKAHHIPFYIEADGGFAKNGRGIKEKIKKMLTSSAKYYFSTSDALDNYYISYGADMNRIYRYPFTSLREIDILSPRTSIIEREEIRKKYRKLNNLDDEFIILSVGQFIYRKGFDVLIHAMKFLPGNYKLYIVGGNGNTYSDIIEDLGIDNVSFISFISKDKLKEFYFAADLFVLPTREDIWGLVINEAMSCALPIITTTKCIAGLELVKDGINGYLVEPDEPKLLSDKISNILLNKDLKDRMGIESLKTIKDYTIENMASRHIDILLDITQREQNINV